MPSCLHLGHRVGIQGCVLRLMAEGTRGGCLMLLRCSWRPSEGRGFRSLEGGVDRRWSEGRFWGVERPWGTSPASGALWPRAAGRECGRPVPHPPLSPQSSDSVPPGYEPISLLEALNGLRAISPAIPSAPLYEEITYSGVSDGLSQASCPLAGIDRILESSHQKGKPRSRSPDR